jgi:hypothetical protein
MPPTQTEPQLEREPWVALRALSGRDELAVDPTQPYAENRFLEGLLADPRHSETGGLWSRLTVSDRDRVLASIYRATYGEEVRCACSCTRCGQRLEIEFSMADLLASRTGSLPSGVRGPERDGSYRLESGVRFRVPTVEDVERAAASAESDPTTALLALCAPDASASEADRIQAAFEAIAPLLDLELEALCPQCEIAQPVRFSIGAFLVQSIHGERKFLLRELHRLAAAYGWKLDEILALRRDDRRALVRLVDAERGRA